MINYVFIGGLAAAIVLLALLLLGFRKRRKLRSAGGAGSIDDHVLGGVKHPTQATTGLRAKKRDIVAAAAVVPSSVALNATFRIWIMISKKRDLPRLVNRRAAETGDVATSARDLSEKIARGARLDAVLTGSSISAPKIIKLRWDGKALEASFQIKLSGDYAEDKAIFDVSIFSEGLCLGVIPLTLLVARSEKSHSQTASLEVPKRIFLSYSSPDRAIALNVARAYRRLGIDTFMDRLSVEGGELWEERLAAEIDKCDAVYLLWSKASANSKYVQWEVRRALARRLADPYRRPMIITHIVGAPPPATPPPDLLALQFNDPTYAVWEQEIELAREAEARAR